MGVPTVAGDAGLTFKGSLPVLIAEPSRETGTDLPGVTALAKGLMGTGGAKTVAANEGVVDVGGLGKGEAITVLKPDGNADGGGMTPMRTTKLIDIKMKQG